jgi:hypothetical protein
MKFVYLLPLLFLCASTEVIVLEEGSLEQQTLSKDGFILYYEKTQPPEWVELIEQTEFIAEIFFFEMNCSKYDCTKSEFVTTLPCLVYSVDNSIWENIDIKSDLYSFTYENFVKNCFLNRKKCKDHELQTLINFENESENTIQETIDELTNRIAELEATFYDYHKKLEEEFNKKRLEIRGSLEKTEDMINVLKDILLSVNSQ